MAALHFNYPFAWSAQTKHISTVEQDTIENITNCIVVALKTEFGFRVEVPTFGIPEQVFELQPLTLESIIDAVGEWEGRAELILTQETDERDVLMNTILAVVNERSADTGG